MSSNFKSILIVGSTGFVGERITRAFLSAHPKWEVAVLASEASQQDPSKKLLFEEYTSKGAKIITGDVTKPETYKGQIHHDVVISTLGAPLWNQQTELARASKEAGVKLFVPSEYGFNVARLRDSPLLQKKLQTRAELEKLAIPHLFVETGPFYEFLFGWKLWGNDLANKKVALIGDRSTKLTFAPFGEVAELLPIVVNDPNVINKAVYFGHTITTGELFDITVEALGGEKNVTTHHITHEELRKKIEAQPSTSIPEQLLEFMVNGSGYEPDAVDGSKYGKVLSTPKQFITNFVKHLPAGVF